MSESVFSLSVHERAIIDCEDNASRVTLQSASEAKGCAFLLISVPNPGFLTESSPTNRETEKDREKERERGSTVHGRERQRVLNRNSISARFRAVYQPLLV